MASSGLGASGGWSHVSVDVGSGLGECLPAMLDDAEEDLGDEADQE